jgi:hypothetical protein
MADKSPSGTSSKNPTPSGARKGNIVVLLDCSKRTTPEEEKTPLRCGSWNGNGKRVMNLVLGVRCAPGRSSLSLFCKEVNGLWRWSSRAPFRAPCVERSPLGEAMAPTPGVREKPCQSMANTQQGRSPCPLV